MKTKNVLLIGGILILADLINKNNRNIKMVGVVNDEIGKVLTRLGNKRRIAKKIIPHFPQHDIYAEPFFGGGGIFFNKPKAASNYINDLDEDVYNLFQVIQTSPKKLADYVADTPYTKRQLEYWKQNQERGKIARAGRFLFLSNYTFLGKGGTLRYERNNATALILKRIPEVKEMMEGVKLTNLDFRSFFKRFNFNKRPRGGKSVFIYCDPPYLNTANNYTKGFSEEDVIDLLEILQKTKSKFDYSEFNQPFIRKQARARGLKIKKIGERINLKNKRTEILIMNY